MWITFISSLLFASMAILMGFSYLFAIFAVLFVSLGNYLLQNSFSYKNYKEGRKLINIINDENVDIIKNTPIYVKNGSVLDMKFQIPSNFNTTIYDFDNTDLILTKDYVILLGIGNTIMVKTYAVPIILGFKQNINYLNFAIINSIKEIGSTKIEFRILDYNYKEELIIQFKNNEKLKEWVLRNNKQ